MAAREEGAAAPNQRQGQNQQQNERQQNQEPVEQQKQHLHINWSNFKPEFSGKPEEDAEAHLLHSNDWMNAHHFVDGVRVQRFSLTLLGGKTVVPIFRTFRQCDMARIAKFI